MMRIKDPDKYLIPSKKHKLSMSETETKVSEMKQYRTITAEQITRMQQNSKGPFLFFFLQEIEFALSWCHMFR